VMEGLAEWQSRPLDANTTDFRCFRLSDFL
jgi:hypothetical protein